MPTCYGPQRSIFRDYNWYIFTSGSTECSFTAICCSGCENVSFILPEDGPLRVETCWGNRALIKWCEKYRCALASLLYEITTLSNTLKKGKQTHELHATFVFMRTQKL